MKCRIVLLIPVACAILSSCKSGPSRQESSVSTSWGPVTDGVTCGISLSKRTYILGDEVEIHVVLKNTRTETVTCNVSTIQSYTLKEDGVREMRLIADAVGGQYRKGREVSIPAGQTVQILSQRFPTRPSLNLMSDLHFTPGSTPTLVVCTPMFDKKKGPLLAGKVSGACSGVVKVEVKQ